MKKQLLLAVVFQTMLLCAQSQTADRRIAPSTVVFDNYTIRVFKTGEDGYGYDIVFQNRLIVHQSNNPFTGLPTGLKLESDALKVAKWQILGLKNRASRQPPQVTKIPMEVARQLEIVIDNNDK